MYLNIKIKEDFRTLKKDTEYKFDFTNQDRYLMLSPSTYIFVETGYDIKIDKDERTEV